MEVKRTRMLICLTLVGGACWRYISSVGTSAAQKIDEATFRSQCSGDSNSQNCPRYKPIDSREQLIERILKNRELLTRGKPQKPAEGSTTTLQQVLLVHRHGDRTPVEFRQRDQLKDEPFWSFFGLGQLTNLGKARVYLMGQQVRERYDLFLNGSVNKNHRISRTSGVLRCVESAELFLASFLALDRAGTSPDASALVWDEPSNKLASLWQPTSLLTVPQRIDGMLAESAGCKNLWNEYTQTINESPEVKRVFSEYAYEAEQLRKLIGFQMVFFQEWFWAGSLLEVERTYFPDKLRPELYAIYDRVTEAANLSLTAYQSTLKARQLRSGLLVQNLLAEMTAKRMDEPGSFPFVHYSTHDLNLVSLLGILGFWDKVNSRPGYASHIIFELHKDPAELATGKQEEWFLRAFYAHQVPGELIEIPLTECSSGHPSGRCRLERFEQLMQKYTLNSWQGWMQECGNDYSQVDPYERLKPF